MTIHFEIILPEYLAAEIPANGIDNLSIREATSDDKARLNLALETAGAIVAIAVGAAQLAEYSLNLARALKRWYRQRRHQEGSESLTIGIRGQRRDGLLEIDVDTQETELAEEIKRIVGD
jgi:hypothetical protein